MKSVMLWSDRTIQRFALHCSTALEQRGIDRLHCSMGKRCKQCRQQKFQYRQLCIGGKIIHKPVKPVKSAKLPKSAKPAKAAKTNKPSWKESPVQEIVNVRATSTEGKREFAVQTDRNLVWVEEHELPAELVAEWCETVDQQADKRYVQKSEERLDHKDRCNAMHCSLIKRLIKLDQSYQRHAHIVLIDPSEEARSAKALLKLGIDKSNIFAPNPNVYTACCLLGFPNVDRCCVSELALRLKRKVASAQLDFTGSFDNPIKQVLTEFFRHINMTDYFVFSLNVSRSRQSLSTDPTKAWRCQVLPFIDNLLAARGYRFHDLVGSQLLHDYASSDSSLRMYYHSWIVCKQ